MSGEKPGRTIVKFNREEGETIVGEVEGDHRPVYVNKKSIRPRLGDIWACHLNVINESGQECYLAILEDKMGFEEPAKASEEEHAIDEPKEASVEETGSPEEDEYKIVEDPRERLKREFIRMRMAARSRNLATMDEDDEEEEESDFVSYEGNGVLRSNLLVFDRYLVFRSSNNRVIQLAPCREGGFRCVEGRIRIGMLDRILGDRVGCQLGFEKEDLVLTVHLDSDEKA